MLIVVISTMTGFFAAVVAAIARGALESARQDPEAQARLSALRSAWSRRKPE
jgi:hypothetical protein